MKNKVQLLEYAKKIGVKGVDDYSTIPEIQSQVEKREKFLNSPMGRIMNVFGKKN